MKGKFAKSIVKKGITVVLGRMLQQSTNCMHMLHDLAAERFNKHLTPEPF